MKNGKKMAGTIGGAYIRITYMYNQRLQNL